MRKVLHRSAGPKTLCHKNYFIRHRPFLGKTSLCGNCSLFLGRLEPKYRFYSVLSLFPWILSSSFLWSICIIKRLPTLTGAEASVRVVITTTHCDPSKYALCVPKPRYTLLNIPANLADIFGLNFFANSSVRAHNALWTRVWLLDVVPLGWLVWSSSPGLLQDLPCLLAMSKQLIMITLAWHKTRLCKINLIVHPRINSVKLKIRGYVQQHSQLRLLWQSWNFL